MNYIRHLTAFYNQVKKDDRLTAAHISLYMALFQYWNYNRFQNPFPVHREVMMQLSKIGSKNTYHKCIKQLHLAQYIYYHSPISKFQPVKISIIRLDLKAEPSTYKQLDFFNPTESESQNPTEKNSTEPIPPPLEGAGGGRGGQGGPSPKTGTLPSPKISTLPCPKIDTAPVPILTHPCPKNDTVPVPNMGHSLKLNILKTKTVCNTPTKIFNKNEKLARQVNSLAGVPNSVHALSGVEGCARNTERSRSIPSMNEIQNFFTQQNYPTTEAQKFFYYNQGRGWMLKDEVPIKDWQSLAHKWMLGIGKNNVEKKENVEAGPDASELSKRFSQGEKIFRHITPQHFDQLQLQLTETLMQHAWQERINQLTGSNQNAILQLLQAYLGNKENDPLLLKDNGNLVTLAKRMAVLQNFQQQNCNPAPGEGPQPKPPP